MTTRTVDRVDDWEEVPFDGGTEGLERLADRSFTGLVRTAGGTACFLDGRIVGVIDGTLDTVADAAGTAYRAPSEALPLLAVMQERTEEPRAKYYTEDTAISEVDRRLSDAGFTGYIELSDNVLSGDYYVVYHGGRSTSVAFVGQSERLITDEEAFELADDEVGIFEVHQVDIDVRDLDAAGDASAASETASTAGDGPSDATGNRNASPGRDPLETTENPSTDERGERTASTDEGTASGPGPDGSNGRDDRSDRPADDTSPADGAGERHAHSEASDTPDGPAEDPLASSGTDRSRSGSGARPESDADEERSSTESAEPDRDTGRSGRESADDSAAGSGRRSPPDRERETDPTARDQDGRTSRDRDGRTSQDQDDRTSRDRNGRTSRDQDDRTSRESADRGDSPGDQQRSSTARDEQRSESARDESRPEGDRSVEESQRSPDENLSPEDLERRSIPSVDPSRSESPSDDGGSAATTGAASAATTRDRPPESRKPSDQIRDLEAQIDERDRRIEDLESTVERLREERAEYRDRIEELEARLDDLEAERDRLATELESAPEEPPETGGTGGTQTAASRTLSAEEALAGTNLFVRYDSRGEATLEEAADGSADRSTVAQNLRLEHHTQFEADDVAVEGDPFEDFLTTSLLHRFVTWLVEDLIYEIRDTGQGGALADLYEALPRIDRAELQGSVSVQVDDGETSREQRDFDVVVRDRMGNPLIVADINDDRDAATGAMMETLVTTATDVGSSHDRFAAGFLVTESYFDPEALETAADATGGGLFSRDSRESYVRLSRKDGFHLCLVEARDDQFHLAVPELKSN